MSTQAIPSVKEILSTGLQFGHSRARWNPKMSQYIFGEKNGIHVIDVVKTRAMLETALNFLTEVSKTKPVLFVGSKRQAAQMVQDEAIRAGGYFVVDRWPGGLLTNFKMASQSLSKLQALEKAFEEGVEGRTKYEVVQMKNEWARLTRLYKGVKHMREYPGAMIVIDPRYERVAVKEARAVGIPVIALADTNCDPDMVDYLVPGNDDALTAIKMVIGLFADAVIAGNEGKGVTHELKEYSAAEVEIHKAKTVEVEEVEEAQVAETESQTPEQPKLRVSAKQVANATSNKGILERVRDQQVKTKADAKSAKKEKEPVAAEKKPTKAKKATAKKTK